jgi:hypothetical protein
MRDSLATRAAREAEVIPYASAVIDLYLKKLIDWEEYYALRVGSDADAKAERETLESVLETAAQICEKLEPELRAGWDEAARLVKGEVVLPAHIQKAYDTLAAAGLVSFGVSSDYGGYGLPTWVSNVILQMIARADAGLMTIVGLQAGAAHDIEMYGSPEIKQRYLPRFASGEIQGCMDLTEPQAGTTAMPTWRASSRRCASTTRPSSATRWRGAACRCTAASATWPSRGPVSTSRTRSSRRSTRVRRRFRRASR